MDLLGPRKKGEGESSLEDWKFGGLIECKNQMNTDDFVVKIVRT
jgi:hypothetical protein